MTPLNGIDAPPGDGMVLEVHLDIMDGSDVFLRRLNELGFESDPFLEFYPAEYTLHYTGRTRAMKKNMAGVLRELQLLTSEVLQQSRASNTKLYLEIELVRDIHHFSERGLSNLSGIAGLVFRPSTSTNAAKGDIHIEFLNGTVPLQVRTLLAEKLFYWVRTPASKRFPSEEIATLQLSSFDDAISVYNRLVQDPLPACTGLHLEQKLAMIPSHPGLKMPNAIDFVGDEAGFSDSVATEP